MHHSKRSEDQSKVMLQEAVSERISEMMGEKGQRMSRTSRSSDYIREKARQILATYN